MWLLPMPQTYTRALCTWCFLAQTEHNTPPKALSGLLAVLGTLLISALLPLATPFNGVWHVEQLGLPGLRLTNLNTVFPPGVFRNILLNTLDLYRPVTIQYRNPNSFKKLT